MGWDFGRMVIVIGAMKSGTSSLHQYLDLHPDVGMSRKKELNFFVEHDGWGRGLGWYRRQLPVGVRVCGESSPNYTKHPTFSGVPGRMSRVMPEARLVYVVRDPIARIMSHYAHNLSHGRESRSVEAALARPETNAYVYPSLYHFQLSRFLTFYTPEQILIVDQKALRDSRRACVRRVFEFIGVDPDFSHPDFHLEHHASNQKGQPTALARKLMGVPGGRALRYALPALFEVPLVRPVLPESVRASLEAVLRPDAEALRHFSGQGFEHWSV